MNKNTKQARAIGKTNGTLKNITAHPDNRPILRNAEDIFKGSPCKTHFGAPGNKRKSKKVYKKSR